MGHTFQVGALGIYTSTKKKCHASQFSLSLQITPLDIVLHIATTI